MHSLDFRAAKKECEFALLGLKGLKEHIVAIQSY